MARHRKSRKHPLFVLLILTGLLEVVIFYYAISRIAKEVRAGVEIHWIAYFTVGLAVASCIHAALSIILFTSLPPRQIPCCSLLTITTLFLGTAWTLSAVAQMFEEPNTSSPTNAEPPMLKLRTILSGVVALALFTSTLLSSLHAFNDEIPGEKDNLDPVRDPSISHTQSSVSQHRDDEARMPLSAFRDSYSGPVELDSYPVETYRTRESDYPQSKYLLR